MSFVSKATGWLGQQSANVNSLSNSMNQKIGNSAMMKAVADGYGRLDKNMYKYLVGDTTSLQYGKVGNGELGTGLVNAGGISYSGADIKIVMNVYNPGNNDAEKRQKQLQDRNADLEKQAQAADTSALISDLNLSTYKFGTKEYDNAKKAQWKAQDEATSLREQQLTNNEISTMVSAEESDKAPTKVLAEAQTLSISVFRDKQAVRSLGSVYPKGYTRGPRQIGGTIVFTVFDRDVLYDFLEAHPTDFDGNRQTSAIIDQLPPVDIIISFANELGGTSRMALYGVEFVSNGQVMSIEDIITENTVEYVARDIDPMSAVGLVDTQNKGRTKQWVSKSGSDLIREQDYQQVKGDVDPFERYKRRNSPFL